MVNNGILISIITVVFNDVKGFEQTIKNVISQTYSNIEYIVIDGSSTDGTVDMIKKYEDKITHWISELDGGIYDAMNKGIGLASGQWINFMNAGDTFADNNVLKKIEFNLYSKNVLIYGNHIYNNEIQYPPDIDKIKFGGEIANHQSMFFNKEVLKGELEYYLEYKIGGDVELFSRIYLSHRDLIKYINITIAIFQDGGIGSVPSLQSKRDKYLMLYRHYGVFGVLRGVIYRIFKK